MCVDVRCMYYLLGLYGRTNDQSKVVQGLLGMGCMFSLGYVPSSLTTSMTAQSTTTSSSSSSTGRQSDITTSSHNHNHNNSLLSLSQKEYLQIVQEVEYVHALQTIWSGKWVKLADKEISSSNEGGGVESKSRHHKMENKENTTENKGKDTTTTSTTTTTTHIVNIKPMQPHQSQPQQLSTSLSATDLLHHFISTSQQLLHHGHDGNNNTSSSPP